MHGLLRYSIRRIIQLIPVLFGVSIIAFSVLHLIPGDPAMVIAGVDARPEELAAIRAEFGLDKPLPVQYITYVAKAVRGDLGMSLRSRDPVMDTLWTRLQFTVQLTAIATAMSAIVGIFLGILAAIHQNTWLDTLMTVVALAGVSVPGFWLGLMMMQVFAGQLGWLPFAGSGTPQHLIMPAIVLGVSGAAFKTRLTRSSMLEVIRQDYIRTLRANGVSDRLVIYKHALRNALNPVITVIGLQFGALLAGSVLIETVFALPGVGRLMVTSIFTRDYPMVQGGILLIALTFLIVNLVVDLTYAVVNPRIRY
ncbi:MAG TPA: ABC transporter permease [Chloroflexota bacterium]|jgi:peptide/nickel transport system permease protein